MTFREKLEVWMRRARIDATIQPVVVDTSSVKALVAEASRLHEEEMAEKDKRWIETVAAVHTDTLSYLRKAEQENSQLREQLTTADVMATAVFAFTCAGTPSKQQSTRLALMEAQGAYAQCRKALSPSSQREEAKECPGPDCKMCNGEGCDKCGAGFSNSAPYCEHVVLERHEPREGKPAPKECDPLHAPCECHCAYPFCGQRMPCRTHSETKPEPERCQVQINMGTNGYVTEWATCGKVLPCPDHPKGE